MAVLIEGISVVIRADSLLAAFNQDWVAFKKTVPNATLCADDELVRVGFMTPSDTEAYVTQLRHYGLVYLEDGLAKDIVVVDQLRGPMARCEWVDFGHVDLDGEQQQRVAACRLKGSTQTVLMRPPGWEYEGSMSQSYGFVPASQMDKSLTFLRREDGLDVYRNELTGEEVYVGRTGGKGPR